MRASFGSSLDARACDRAARTTTRDESPPDDFLSPTRTLRRIALSFTGRAPVASEYQAILDAKDDTARQAVLDKAVDDALASPNFYDIMRDFGREWMALPSIVNVADAPGYVASQQNNIAPCPANTRTRAPSPPTTSMRPISLLAAARTPTAPTR